MDPLAFQAGSANSVRPVLALDASLTSVLREGRMVAGQVLQSMDGGSLLVGIGRHRVPADANVDLQPGDRFLARVEKTDQGTVLRILGERGEAEPRLLTALRAVVGNDRPIGELLGDLASKLRASANSAGTSEKSVADLLQQLGGHVFEPGSSGSDLQRLIARSGLDLEALLLSASQGGKSPAAMGSLLSSLAEELLLRLQTYMTQLGLGLSKNDLKLLEKSFLEQLATLQVDDGAPNAMEKTSRLGQAIEARLASAIRQSMKGRAREALLETLKPLLASFSASEAGAKALDRLLRVLTRQQDSSAITMNLKGRVLAALASLPEGEARDAAVRMLAGIESEQLLNLARREFHEGWHLALPVPDGDRWATAQLFYHDSDDSRGQRGGRGEDMQRLTVAVDFSALGPLRAEIGVRDDLVALRIVVTRPEIAERLRGEAAELLERLGTGGREARISVTVGKRDETDVDSLATDIRWLREHHLMDLSG